MKISIHDMYVYGKDYIWTIIAEDETEEAKSDLLIPILLPFKISIFVVGIIALKKIQWYWYVRDFSVAKNIVQWHLCCPFQTFVWLFSYMFSVVGAGCMMRHLNRKKGQDEQKIETLKHLATLTNPCNSLEKYKFQYWQINVTTRKKSLYQFWHIHVAT